MFGAAIWSVDYVLYGAGLKVSRMYFHNGTPYRYSAWQPIVVNSTAAHVMPIYYGSLFLSTALAGGDKQVVNILNDTTLTAYAIYQSSEVADSNNTSSTLEGIAIVNMEMYNSTQPASERPYTQFELPFNASEWSGAQVHRLTAPGVDSKEHITFAGKSVNSNGQLQGTTETETVKDGGVLVGAGEAVLIAL